MIAGLPIHPGDLVEQMVGGRLGGGHREDFGPETQLLRQPPLVAHVLDRGGAVAGENRAENRPESVAFAEFMRVALQLRLEPAR